MDNNQVSVQELLAIDPFTSFKIIGGWSGKNNNITDIISLVDVEKELVDNSLLILKFGGSSIKEKSDIIEQALKKTIAGIFIIGEHEPYLAVTIINIANKVEIPIIYLQDVDDIVTVIDTFQYIKKLKEMDYFLKYVQSSNLYMVNLLNDKGISALITYLETITDNQVIITNPFFELINIKDYSQKELVKWKEYLKYIKQSYYNNLKDSSYTSYNKLWLKIKKPDTDTNIYSNYFLIKLKSVKTNYGFLLVEEKQNKLIELNLVQLEKVTAPIVSELIKISEILEAEKKYKDNFIYDVLNNNFESLQMLIKQGKIWGWNLSIPHHLLIIEVETDKHHNIEQTLIDKIQNVIKNVMSFYLQNPIIVELNEQIIVMLPDADERKRKERKEYIKNVAKVLKDKIVTQISDTKVSIGIGRFYPSTSELCRSYQEAKTSIELGRFASEKCNITHFEDLGAMRLLANIRQEQLDDFYQEYLGELISFDKNSGTDFVETLQTFFAENGNLKATADKLYVHINTLRYRLKKIESILDVDLEQSDDFLNLLITLKILTMRQ